MNKENKSMVDANYNYYQTNLNKLMVSYGGEYIILQDLKVVCNNKSKIIVTKYAESLSPGTFIILKIQPQKS